jgi:hypothetical protein
MPSSFSYHLRRRVWQPVHSALSFFIRLFASFSFIAGAVAIVSFYVIREILALYLYLIRVPSVLWALYLTDLRRLLSELWDGLRWCAGHPKEVFTNTRAWEQFFGFILGVCAAIVSGYALLSVIVIMCLLIFLAPSHFLLRCFMDQKLAGNVLSYVLWYLFLLITFKKLVFWWHNKWGLPWSRWYTCGGGLFFIGAYLVYKNLRISYRDGRMLCMVLESE